MSRDVYHCVECGEEVMDGIVHKCKPPAERSGVPQGCLPSANCSARPPAVAPKDSLISSVVPREKAEPPGTVALAACQWKEDADTWSWDTSCDEKFQFTNDGPNENGYRFCPACGKPITLAGEPLREPGGAAPCGQRAVARND